MHVNAEVSKTAAHTSIQMLLACAVLTVTTWLSCTMYLAHCN